MKPIIYAKISHPDAADGWQYNVDFPAREADISALLQELKLPEVSTDKNCELRALTLLGTPFPLPDGTCCNLDEMNYLAKRLGSFDRKECNTFLAAAQATHAEDVAALINLTFNTHCYSVVDSFQDVEKLGERLYLNEHIAITSGETHDYRQYALDVLAQPPLAVTQFGIVFANSNQPEEIYNGRQFPQYSYSGNAAATLTVQTISGDETEVLDLPCEPIALQKALARLGGDCPEGFRYTIESELLPKTACDIFENSDQPTHSFPMLNALAEAASKLSTSQYSTFLALCAWAQPETLANHVTLCEHCDVFQFVPGVTDLEQYGRKLIAESGKEPGQDALAYFDFAGYAKSRLAQSPGEFTEYGLLKYRGESPEIARLAKLPFEQMNCKTLRLFSPIHCDFYERNRYGNWEETPESLDACEAVDYSDSIAKQVEACNQREGPRGLAPYLSEGSLSDKVYSMIPTVEEYGGRLFGVLECRLREPLTTAEYEQLCSEWEGQMSDGYGESLEQQEIKLSDGVMLAHFWDSDSGWSIQTEAQLKGEPEQGFGMQMQ